jgi:hypothetical protein
VQAEEALKWYGEMLQQDIKPTAPLLTSIIDMYATVSLLMMSHEIIHWDLFISFVKM